MLIYLVFVLVNPASLEYVRGQKCASLHLGNEGVFVEMLRGLNLEPSSFHSISASFAIFLTDTSFVLQASFGAEMEAHSGGGGGQQQQQPSSGHRSTGAGDKEATEALREAVETCQPGRVIELLKMGAPSVLDAEGQTPLHLAAANGHLQLVDALIQAGCDVTVQDFVSTN